MKRNIDLINQTFQLWNACAPMRNHRRRLLKFAYGNQWDDTYRNQAGRIITERQAMLNSGRIPVTNNLIRQMIKSIIGHYRHLALAPDAEMPLSPNTPTPYTNQFAELDARALEEFLISGCAIQRIADRDEQLKPIINVNPERFFHTPFTDPDATDCLQLGMLHDMTPADILRQFTHGSINRAQQIKQILTPAKQNNNPLHPTPTQPPQIDFNTPQLPLTHRIIEIWQRKSTEIIRCHDTEKADYYTIEATPQTITQLNETQQKLQAEGKPQIKATFDIIDSWHQTWLTTDGYILDTIKHTPQATHPFAIKFHPMTDSTTHSLVDDVIEQQKYINRLITMLDDIISSSAKGVLLFPTDQLPDGFTWRDMRHLWSQPGAIIPYRRSTKSPGPHQVNTPATSAGATEMLKLQMQLFDEISGTQAIMRGKTPDATGAQMLQTQLQTATIAMLDILATFRSFIDNRNSLLTSTNV